MKNVFNKFHINSTTSLFIFQKPFFSFVKNCFIFYCEISINICGCCFLNAKKYIYKQNKGSLGHTYHDQLYFIFFILVLFEIEFMKNVLK